MSAPLQELVERIRGEVQDLERVAQRAMLAWPQVRRALDGQNVYLDSSIDWDITHHSDGIVDDPRRLPQRRI